MILNLLKKTARYAVIEIDDGGNFYTKETYAVWVNGEKILTDRCVTVLHGLKPENAYEVKVESGDKNESEILSFETDYESITLNVKELGAFGDGIHDDTVFLQAAVAACPKDGRVLVPEGIYNISNLFLKSGLNLELAKNSVLKCVKDRNLHPHFPGELQTYDEKEEIVLGTWEGNPRPMFAGIITGMDVRDLNLYGEGTIDGNASKDDWWKNPKIMNVAYRPRTVFLKGCSNVSMTGLTVVNSPSWTIHPYECEDISFYGLTIRNPEDSPNTDGIDPESCKNVSICGVHFSLGDDCIAVKSGKIYLGKKNKRPSENIRITRCFMENGHGAVTLGSEIAGGVKGLYVSDCFFRNTDRGLRIKTRRGRGKDSVLDDIVFENILMEEVKTPFTVNCFYFCDPDGKTSYVQSREALPVDDRTPGIGTLVFKNIKASGCHVAAMYCDGLPEKKIEKIELENIRISFTEGEAINGVPIMSDGVAACSKKGITIHNVKNLILKNVSVLNCDGESIDLNGIDNLDSFQ